MVDAVVRYLRGEGASFRLLSFPAPEPKPSIAAQWTRSPECLLVSTQILCLDEQPTLVCVLDGERVQPLRVRHETGATLVEDGSVRDLPWPFRAGSEPIPPLGTLFGVPTLLDEAATQAPLIAFAVFSPFDIIEMSFEDFARIEHPRIASFVAAGELPETTVH